MTVPFLDTWVPNGPFPIVRAEDVKGGFQVVADDAAREAIPRANQVVGMVVYQLDTQTFWELEGVDDPPNNNWITSEIQYFRIAATTGSRDLIADSARRQGMLVPVIANGLIYTLSGGVTNSHWVVANQDLRTQGGVKVVADDTEKAAIGTNFQRVGELASQNDDGAGNATLYRLASTGPAAYDEVLKFLGDAHIGVGTLNLDQLNSVPTSGAAVQLNGFDFQVLGAMNGAVSDQTTVRRSKVISGCECVPTITSSGSTRNALVRVHPGMVAFAGDGVTGGLVRYYAGNGGTTSLNTASNYIEGSVPSFPANVYVFLKITGTSIAVKLSASPPDERCSPTASVSFDGTYAYVGMLRPLLGTVSGNSYPHRALWGNFTVTHDRNGKRIMMIDQSDTSGNALATDTLSLSTGGSGYVSVTSAMGGVSGAYPTAHLLQYGVMARINQAPSNGDTISFALTAGGVYLNPYVDHNVSIAGEIVAHDVQTSFWAPPIQSEILALHGVSSGGYTGTAVCAVTGRILTVVENINYPYLYGVDQRDFGNQP